MHDYIAKQPSGRVKMGRKSWSPKTPEKSSNQRGEADDDTIFVASFYQRLHDYIAKQPFGHVVAANDYALKLNLTMEETVKLKKLELGRKANIQTLCGKFDLVYHDCLIGLKETATEISLASSSINQSSQDNDPFVASFYQRLHDYIAKQPSGHIVLPGDYGVLLKLTMEETVKLNELELGRS